MTARDAVVGALVRETGTGGRLQGVNVLAYADDIDPPSKPTVMVRVDEVVPAPLPTVWRVYRFTLICLPTQTIAGAADDEVDGLREDVLHALDAAPDLTWTKCTRGVYADKYPAYEVALELPFQKD